MKKKKLLKIRNVRKSTKIIKPKAKKIQKKKKIAKVEPLSVTVSEKLPEPVPTPPVDSTIPVKKKRGRRSKGGVTSDKMYFTKDTEDSIIRYNSTTETQLREDIYNTQIKYPFEKLVENIFNTFKFSYFETGPLDVQKETVAHLVSNIHKFEAGKGKAFSYFSIIAKHYLIALNNSTYKRRNQHVEIGEEHDENTVQLQTEDKHYKDKETKEFMDLMILFWENNVGKIFTKQRDLDIANAVIHLLRESKNLEVFNKKYLYLCIREISDCRTQQITKILNRMKTYQSQIRHSYINNGVFNTSHYIKKTSI